MDKIQNSVSNVSIRRKGTSLGVVQQLPVLRVERRATERVRRPTGDRERERESVDGRPMSPGGGCALVRSAITITC